MEIWGSVLGGYPRTREERHALRDLERGAIATHELEIRTLMASSVIIGSQEAVGLRYVVDGMVDWHDMFRPFASAWRNVTVGGLLRYFDNNFFYRIPVFTDRPDPEYFVWPGRLRTFSAIADPQPLKVVVPGPLTFTLMSKNASGMSKEDLAASIASALALELRAAQDSGAIAVQIDEPMLSDSDISADDARLAAELISSMVSGLKVPSILAIYYNVPRDDVYERLLDTKVTYISLDVADAPSRALDLIAKKGFGGHRPVLGLIDARRIEDDDYERVKEWLLQATRGYDGDVGVTTTTWFDTIPYRYSLRKTVILGSYVERLASEVSRL